ncbi:hypothetical protein [Cohnella nanjingensis]|uniref:Uncharacterized protein n=1 Tax=Cohnella nanjingensis TaxID=1387779 RepID=A0A7X0RS42_9BACL|nr:hypothetical protein [Cohnella nanjingensis]MBB6672663.1 hypothetical protein [Cohnella nanjingensis]
MDKKKVDRIVFHHTSVRAMGDQALLTAPAGRGVWVSSASGEWEACMTGLPADVHVNRLCSEGGRIYACTDKGLYHLAGDRWTDLDLPYVCYEYKENGGRGYAATERGLWCRTLEGWRNVAYARSPVYDMLLAPQFIFLALHAGISMYDRLTGSWAKFPSSSAVVRLATDGGALMGITEQGELLLGNKRGGFERVRFPGFFLFNAARRDGTLYMCADRGLYRLSAIRGQPALVSVSMGCPVTDVDSRAGQLHMATLNEGIQSIQL